MSNLHAELLAAWLKPVAKTCTSKDVPRLATRFDVITTSTTTSTPSSSSSKKAVKQSNKQGETKSNNDNTPTSRTVRIQAILSTIRKLSLFFQLDSEPAIQTTLLQDTTPENPDLSSFVQHLIENLGSDASPIVRILKCCHQNILFIAIYELKTSVLQDINTKDTHSDDSWRIRITAESGRVQVTHQRKEQIIGVPGTLEWEISMTFDGKVEEMCSSTLRLTGLEMKDNAKTKDKLRLARKLSGGKLIVQ